LKNISIHKSWDKTFFISQIVNLKRLMDIGCKPYCH
jgi:hypothetical protein